MQMNQNWKTCGGHAAVTRRHFLFGAATGGLLRVRADAETATSRTAARPRGSARACIFINLNGGPNPLDTFHPQDSPRNTAHIRLGQPPVRPIPSQKLFP